jgi:hypothetical protein
MRPISLYTLAALMLPMVTLACNEAPRSSSAPVAQPEDDAARNMAQIDADVRLDVALKRIATLEREVAELKAGPATVETDMLRQQLSATQNALAAASRDPVPDGETLTSGPNTAAPRAVATSSARASRRSEQPTAGTGANTTPGARPKVQATNRPSLNLNLQ